MTIIQNTLLYNVSVARSIQRGELVETIGIERLRGNRDDSEGNGHPGQVIRHNHILRRVAPSGLEKSRDRGMNVQMANERDTLRYYNVFYNILDYITSSIGDSRGH